MLTPNEEKQIQTTTIERFNKLHAQLNKMEVKEIGLDFVLGSLFPDLTMNFKEICDKFYTQGYIAGLKENEDKGNN